MLRILRWLSMMVIAVDNCDCLPTMVLYGTDVYQEDLLNESQCEKLYKERTHQEMIKCMCESHTKRILYNWI
ncbi:hypothetical protein ECANGB1_2102 [Enterospora canceri]|uniref:Uncharacterized protein n=1 Tax=Enterospora canceri TaxID=1081671 RepID=A0A1Y1S8W6_9MICR|nr:hypothetical protein ECANGB1_2102 [Enterospora canceri]